MRDLQGISAQSNWAACEARNALCTTCRLLAPAGCQEPRTRLLAVLLNFIYITTGRW